jgi:hypothetical protein
MVLPARASNAPGESGLRLAQALIQSSAELAA